MGKKLDERQKEYMLQVGSRIRFCRENKGLSQAELARLVGYEGRSAVNKIEAGQRNVTTALISKFAQCLGTSPAYLMGWTDDPTLNAQRQSTENEIINLVQTMSEDEKQMLLKIIKGIKG